MLTALDITIASLAAIIDFSCGYPPKLVKFCGHPVMWIGYVISKLDRYFNRPTLGEKTRYVLGCVTLLVLLGVTVGITVGLLKLGYDFLPSYLMFILQIIIGSALLAQKSLWDHVCDVKDALKEGDFPRTRRMVAKIVGRDTQDMNEEKIVCATLESLSENFSDGVVAPLFWFVLFGLPGIVFYKTINTADSMIGHFNERYRAFGWATAKLDDLVNYIPARLCAVLILFVVPSQTRPLLFRQVMEDASRQASPNAGWPESALAAVLGVSLGGVKSYQGKKTFSPPMGVQTHPIGFLDIVRGLWVYKRACIALIYSLLFLAMWFQLMTIMW